MITVKTEITKSLARTLEELPLPASFCRIISFSLSLVRGAERESSRCDCTPPAPQSEGGNSRRLIIALLVFLNCFGGFYGIGHKLMPPEYGEHPGIQLCFRTGQGVISQANLD